MCEMAIVSRSTFSPVANRYINSPDLRLRAEANATSRWALGISIISAVIALLSFGYPIHTTNNRNSDHAKEFVAALASPDRQTFLTAMSHVQQDSSAEVYLQNVDDWWSAAFRSSGARTWADYKPKAGSYEAEGDGYRICLPQLVQLTTTCSLYSGFVHNSQTGLVSRFSIEKIPVDVLSLRRNSDVDRLGDEGGLKVFARAYGRMVSPDQSTVCMSFYLSVETDDKRPSIYFNRKSFVLEDQNEQPAKGKVYWPSKLNYLERADGVACLPAPGGYVKIVRQKSKSKPAFKSMGWLSVR